MARWEIAATAMAIALAATGCGPVACELWEGPFGAHCVEDDLLLPGSEEDCQCWATCKSLGYTLPCTATDGSTYWKRPEDGYCWEPPDWPP